MQIDRRDLPAARIGRADLVHFGPPHGQHPPGELNIQFEVHNADFCPEF